jgi:hypothetical protein
VSFCRVVAQKSCGRIYPNQRIVFFVIEKNIKISRRLASAQLRLMMFFFEVFPGHLEIFPVSAESSNETLF